MYKNGKGDDFRILRFSHISINSVGDRCQYSILMRMKDENCLGCFPGNSLSVSDMLFNGDCRWPKVSYSVLGIPPCSRSSVLEPPGLP